MKMKKIEVVYGILAGLAIIVIIIFCSGIKTIEIPVDKLLITFCDGKTKIIKNCSYYEVSDVSTFYVRPRGKESYKNVQSVNIIKGDEK